MLAEVRPEECAAFEAHFGAQSIARIGAVSQGTQLTIANRANSILALDIAALVAAWSGKEN
jgi:hypothetical protein